MYDAVVLAGGRGSRLGGAHKPGLELAGVTLLDRVLSACAGAERRVVVGPVVVAPGPAFDGDAAVFVQEPVAFGGPAAAVRAGLVEVTAPTVVLLAADLYALTLDDVTALAAAAPAVLVDDSGREQWLCSAWQTGALRAAVAAAVPGDALGPLLRGLAPTAIMREGAPWRDVDTPEDWERACRTTT